MSPRDSIDIRQNRTVIWALGLSIAIHALLLVLSIFFPMGSAVPAAELQLEETVLRFTFDQPRSEPTTDDPEQDSRLLPVEPVEPPTPPTLPLPQPERPTDAAELRPPQPEPLPEPVERAPEEPEPEANDDLTRSPAAPTVSDPAGTVRSTAAEDRFSMERAMRDFGELLEKVPRRTSGPPRASGINSNVVQPDLSQIPSVGYGMGNLVFESRDYDWNDYGRQVYMAIWRAWHNRLYVTYDEFEKWAARTGVWRLNHQTRVHFVIERNGAVTGVTLDDGSTCRPFDDSAIEALEEVILPPLPADFPRDREVVHARFVGQGPIRAMPSNLRMLKRAGYF